MSEANLYETATPNATASTTYPMVPLGEILSKSEEWIQLDSERIYKQVTVRMWGQGVVQRCEVAGVEVAASRMLVVHANQFIISRIDARNGASGLIPDFLDGAIVTNDFPVFTPNPAKILPSFLSWMSKTHGFVDLCKAASEGTTNRIRLKEDRFLSMEIPLPPLAEQRRIVARVEELAGKVEEARGLRSEVVKETDALIPSKLNAFLHQAKHDGTRFVKVGDVTAFDRYGPRFYNEPYVEDGVPILRATDINDEGRIDYRFMPKIALDPEEVKVLSLQPGDLVVIRSGSIGLSAVFDRSDIDCIASAYAIQFRFDESVDPYYVRYCFQSPLIKEELAGRGTSLKNINSPKIKATKIPFLSLPEQHRIVAYLDNLQAKIDGLKRLQAETEAELNALLPSILDKAFKGEL